jgi:choline kinase
MHSAARVLQTVILAAGSGSRLTQARGDVPKPLMNVAGVPLVGHALSHARASGCTEAIVVIGYDGARVKAAVQAMHPGLRVRFVETADPAAPNGVSLLAAEPLALSQFFLQMVDHLFAVAALSKLISVPLGAAEAGRVLVDSSPGDIDLSDATKVRLSGTRVLAIGKRIEPWDAVDAGCFVLTPAVFDALRSAPASEPRTVSSGMRQLVAHGLLGAVDLKGMPWVDVDTPADRDVAERLMGQPLCEPELP